MKDPVKNMVWAKYPFGDVTQWLGENAALYANLTDYGLVAHNGIDIVRKHGEHMYAVEDCIVADATNDPNGYGNHLRLFSTDISREWTYGHCHYIGVKVGQKVKAGQFVATMGNTGFVVSGDTPYWVKGGNLYGGTHLHLGLRLIKPSEKGWSYPESDIKISVKNYSNGYRGSVDPLPYFVDTTKLSYRVGVIAQAKNDRTVWEFSRLLKTINL